MGVLFARAFDGGFIVWTLWIRTPNVFLDESASPGYLASSAL